MRYFIHFLLFSSLFFASCNKQGNEFLIGHMDDIKAMGDTLPKVAMLRLDSIKPLFENECEYMRNKFALLDIRLHDKAYITHTSIKPIEDVCRYFEENGTVAEVQEAYYYMASVYRDLNDYPNAVTYFLKSAEVAENNSDIDSARWECTYSQLSYLYNQQFNYSSALDAAIKALDIAEKFQTVNERTYMNVASAYYESGDTTNATSLCNKAINNILGNGISKNNADIVSKAMYHYTIFNQYLHAKLCYELLKSLPKNELPRNYIPNVAVYLERFVSADSAAVAMSELYNTTNSIESKYDAARWLTRYYVAKGEYEKAAGYAINFINANEAVIDKRNFEHTTNANNFYQYRRDKEEEMAIMEKAARDRFNLLLGFSTFIVAILVITVIYYNKKQRLIGTILEKDNNIKEIKLFLQEKEKELESICSAKARLAEQLENSESDFKMLIAQNRELTRLTIMSNISCDANDIIEKAKKASKGKYHLNDEEWKELLGAIDRLYPEFTYEVQANFKRISEPVLRVCYLLKIGMSAPQIVNLTGYPRQTVFDRIKRIKSTIDIDVWDKTDAIQE